MAPFFTLLCIVQYSFRRVRAHLTLFFYAFSGGNLASCIGMCPPGAFEECLDVCMARCSSLLVSSNTTSK